MSRVVAVFMLLGLAACAGQSDWRTVGGEPWLVGESLVPAGAGGPSMLVSRSQFSDVLIEVEFKPDAAVNSGVFFRCQNPEQITPMNCYEANIWDNHPVQAFRTGAVVEVFSPPIAHVDTIGKWNTYEIRAEGDDIRLRVNGEVTAMFSSDRFASGYIALQWSGEGDIEFRNLVITEL